jgi:hypothetical protein
MHANERLLDHKRKFNEGPPPLNLMGIKIVETYPHILMSICLLKAENIFELSVTIESNKSNHHGTIRNID